jgi:hypothetical protein
MAGPTSPPLMPPSGWYPDPEQAWTWRYWDGAGWTDHRAPRLMAPGRDPFSFSVWFEESFAAFKAVARRVGLLIAAVWVIAVALYGVVFYSVFNSSNGREIRELIEFDRIFDSTGTADTVVLTDAEWNRVGDLFVDSLWAALPWLVAISIVVLFGSAWSVVMAARVADRVGDGAVDEMSRADDAAEAIRRVPAVVGSVIVLLAISSGVFLVAFAPLLVALVVDADGTVIALAVVFGLPAGLVAFCWLWGRLALAIVISSIGGHGVGIRRSWELTHGRYWGVVGRLLVAGLIASAVTIPFSFVNNVALAFGFGTWLVSVLALQVGSNTMSTLSSVPAQVVLVRHLTDQRQGLLG